MKRVWAFVALGIGAYLVFALATVPAGVVFSRLTSYGVSAAGVEGTVWQGRAQVLQVANINFGSVTWDLHILPLFTGRVQADVQVNRSDGFARTNVVVSPSGRVQFKQLTASVPLSAMAAAVPGGWNGTLNLKLTELTLDKGWPSTAQGTVEALDLIGPARRPAKIGSYKVLFADRPGADEPAASDALTGALTDMGGPLQISGTLQLKPDRNYVIEGLVATRPDTPRDVADALQFLGPADAEGRRPFSIAGAM